MVAASLRRLLCSSSSPRLWVADWEESLRRRKSVACGVRGGCQPRRALLDRDPRRRRAAGDAGSVRLAGRSTSRSSPAVASRSSTTLRPGAASVPTSFSCPDPEGEQCRRTLMSSFNYSCGR